MSEADTEFLEFLSKQIELHDRMVTASDFPIDQEIYNQQAHLLRRIKDEFLSIKRKEYDAKQQNEASNPITE